MQLRRHAGCVAFPNERGQDRQEAEQPLVLGKIYGMPLGCPFKLDNWGCLAGQAGPQELMHR